MGAGEDRLSFIEYGTQLRDGLIVGRLGEVVEPNGERVGDRVGKQVHFVLEDLAQQDAGVIGARQMLSQ